MQLSVDIGGTFTDFVCTDDNGNLETFKVPSVPKKPEHAISNGLKLVKSKPTSFLHGTTTATNTVLERSGSRTAFITTSGFKDLLHIGRQTRPSLYDFRIIRKPPLVPRKLCFEINERIDARGNIIVKLEKKELESLVKKLKSAKVSSAAVCLLFSYLNSAHERAVGRVIGKNLKIPVALSSDVLPEFREFERASTTVMNAYLLKKVGDYVKNLQRIISKAGLKDFFIMQSSGGVANSKYIQEMPVKTLLSGPAAGVSASAYLGSIVKEPNLITFDMGGTSADIATVVDNHITWTPDGEIDSLPLKIPMVEIVTIGAGGGSIAAIDSGGALQVGPQSAGADPGPVCYGRSGKNITVTDANLLRGIIDASFFLGGQFYLDKKAALRAAKKFSSKLNYTVTELAEGIQHVVEANMLRAIKSVSVEKGLEPKEFSMVAFGGAGPIHAASLARELSIPKVIVPVSPGTFSAYGLQISDVKLDLTKTYLAGMEDRKIKNKIRKILDEQKKEAKISLKSQNLDVNRAEYYPSLDLRYRGQGYEVNVPFQKSLGTIINLFHEVHGNRFGYCMPDAPVELVNVRLTVRIPRSVKKLKVKIKRKEERGSLRLKPLKELNIIINGKKHKTPLYDRELMKPGNNIRGPAIIAESGSTTFIMPGMKLKVDSYKNLIISIK